MSLLQHIRVVSASKVRGAGLGSVVGAGDPTSRDAAGPNQRVPCLLVAAAAGPALARTVDAGCGLPMAANRGPAPAPRVVIGGYCQGPHDDGPGDPLLGTVA